METKNPPQESMAGFDIVSLGTRRYEADNTPNYAPHKLNLEKTPPFAERTCKKSRLWHVRVGLDAFEFAAKDYENADPRYPISVLALPWNANPFDFNWPVYGKSVDILSCGKHSRVVQQLGDALHQSGALNVYGRIDGDIIHWHNVQLEDAA